MSLSFTGLGLQISLFPGGSSRDFHCSFIQLINIYLMPTGPEVRGTAIKKEKRKENLF